ncbi:MAG: DUF6318 family protein [Ornithinimicrobium sp.]
MTLAFGLSLVLEEYPVRRLSALAVCLAMGGVLAACDDGQRPQEPPQNQDSVGAADDSKATSVGDDAASKATSAADSAGQTADPGVPEMPPEATEDSEAGAAAFAEYYLDLYNHLGRYPQDGVLNELASNQCDTCRNYEDNVESLSKKDQRLDGPSGIVTKATALASGPDSYVVSVVARTPAYRRLGIDGTEIDRFSQGSDIELSVDVRRLDASFLVEGVFVVQNDG